MPNECVVVCGEAERIGGVWNATFFINLSCKFIRSELFLTQAGVSFKHASLGILSQYQSRIKEHVDASFIRVWIHSQTRLESHFEVSQTEHTIVNVDFSEELFSFLID